MEGYREYYMGRTHQYWLELQRRFDKEAPGEQRLLEEIAQLRGRLNFYEVRIKELAHISEKSI